MLLRSLELSLVVFIVHSRNRDHKGWFELLSFDFERWDLRLFLFQEGLNYLKIIFHYKENNLLYIN